jgi:GT2 family glycosyltransferase
MNDTHSVAVTPVSNWRELAETSLIIPSRNRPDLLRATVESILQGSHVPSELIIVDQSDHSDRELASCKTTRDCAIRYTCSKDVGVSRARNAGTALARHGILVFTDDDVQATRTWFRSLVQSLLASGPKAVVTGQVLTADADGPGAFAPSTTDDPVRKDYAGRVEKDVLFSGNMALYRSALEQVGGFDECLGPGTVFAAAEDNDLGFRLLEAGYQIRYVPEAMLYHRAWRSERDYLPLRWNYARGQGAFYAKHVSLNDRYMLARMLRHLQSHATGFVGRMGHDRLQAYGDAVYMVGLVTGAAQWLLTQRSRN